MSDTDPIDPFKPREVKPESKEETAFDHAGTFAWPSSTAPEAPRKAVAPGAPPSYRPILTTIWNHPAARIVAYFAAFFAAALLLKVLLMPFGSLLQQAPPDIVFPFSLGFEAAAAVLALFFMLRVAERRRMRDAGFTFRGVVNETITGTMIGISVISVTIGLMAMIGVYHVVGRDPSFHPWLLLTGYLFGAIAEETVFRGFTFRVLEYRYGSFVALVVSGLFFGLVHLSNETGMQLSLIKEVIGPLFISFEAGLLLAAAYMATRRLWLPIGIHWAWNYFEGPVYGAQVSGTSIGGSFLRASIQGRFLLTGGAFGPEASVVCLIVCTLAGLLLLRVAIRAGQWHPAGEWEPASEARRVA